MAGATALGADDPLCQPTACSKYIARFAKTHFGPRNENVGARLTVADRLGRKLFEDDLSIDIRSAQWTPDERYLVFTSISSAGHSPWRFFVDIFSVEANEIRVLDPSVDPPIVSASMLFEPPNTLILIGGSAGGIDNAQDCIPVLFKLDQIWPTLKKTSP